MDLDKTGSSPVSGRHSAANQTVARGHTRRYWSINCVKLRRGLANIVTWDASLPILCGGEADTWRTKLQRRVSVWAGG